MFPKWYVFRGKFTDDNSRFTLKTGILNIGFENTYIPLFKRPQTSAWETEKESQHTHIITDVKKNRGCFGIQNRQLLLPNYTRKAKYNVADNSGTEKNVQGCHGMRECSPTMNTQ